MATPYPIIISSKKKLSVPMKKFILLSLLLVPSLCFTACSNDDEITDNEFNNSGNREFIYELGKSKAFAQADVKLSGWVYTHTPEYGCVASKEDYDKLPAYIRNLVNDAAADINWKSQTLAWTIYSTGYHLENISAEVRLDDNGYVIDIQQSTNTYGHFDAVAQNIAYAVLDHKNVPTKHVTFALTINDNTRKWGDNEE